MSDILLVGWVLLDFVGYVDAFPVTGGTAVARDFDAACGGRAANQAMAITAVEGDVALIAHVGSDRHADVLLEELGDIGVLPDFITPAPAATGMRLVSLRDDGKRQSVTYAGANEFLTVDDINRRSPAFAAARVVGVTAEPAGAVTLRALELAQMSGIPRILTHVPGAQLSDRVLEACGILVVSASQAHGVLDPTLATEQPEHAARALLQRGAGTVIVLSGDRAVIVDAQGTRMMPSPSPLDGEDACDAFVGGLLIGLSMGERIDQALTRGVRVACLLVD